MQLAWSSNEFSTVIIFQFFSTFCHYLFMNKQSDEKACITLIYVIGGRLV